MTRQELIAQLIRMQNHPMNQNIDILTITGFMNDAEVLKHAARIKLEIIKLDRAA